MRASETSDLRVRRSMATPYSVKVELIMILNRTTVAAEGEKVGIGLDWMP